MVAAEFKSVFPRRNYRLSEERTVSLLIPNGPPLAMYDIGVGCFYEFHTLTCIWPDMLLFGCEPCRPEYDDLLQLFNGKLAPVALGAASGRRVMQVTRAGVGGSSFYRKGASVFQPEEVEVWTLDQFDEWAGCPDKILLWMDIEDSELDALAGGHTLLASGRVEWLNIETRDENEPGLPTTALVSAALEPYGYVPVHRYNVQGAYPEAPGDMIYFKRGVVPLLPCNGGVQQ